MCSGIFQRFSSSSITCLWFTATLTKSKHVENASTYLKLVSTKCLYGCFAEHGLAYISSTFINITTPFISINLDILQNPLEQRLFLLSYVFFKNQNITFFASFLFSCFEWSTYFLLSKIRIAVIFTVSIMRAHSNWLIG